LVLTFEEEARAGHLRSLARSLGILEHVHFKGFVAESDLHRLWQSASALVFPSLHEGFGIPLLEAMHYGVPIIAGDDFSLKEVAGDACYLIDPRKPISVAEAMLEITLDTQLRADLVKRGHHRLHLFDLNVAAKSLLEVLYATVRGERGFPRKPSYAHKPPILTAPTPASEDPWQIELQIKPTACVHTLCVYLDDLPFGSFAAKERSFSFVCRPDGRMLNLRVMDDNNTNTMVPSNGIEIPVSSISAKDSRGRRISLYGGSNPSMQS